MGGFLVILNKGRKGKISGGGSTPTPPDSHISSRLIDDDASHLLDDDGNYLVDVEYFLLDTGDRLLLEDGVSFLILE